MSIQEARGSNGFGTISDVRQQFGLSARALRFYEDKGLIAPTRVRRQRFYTPEDIERLRLVLRLKAFGLSLVEIRQVIHNPGDGPYGLSYKLCEELIERLTEQKRFADVGLEQLQQIAVSFRD